MSTEERIASEYIFQCYKEKFPELDDKTIKNFILLGLDTIYTTLDFVKYLRITGAKPGANLIKISVELGG
jgi:hypothetical protein